MKDSLIVYLIAAMFIFVGVSLIMRVKDGREQDCAQSWGATVSSLRIICFDPGVTIEYR